MGDERECKLVLVGNGSVGKSSIVNCIMGGGFERIYRQTIGVDFFQKKISLKNDTVTMNLQVFDIGGQSMNSPMLAKYLTGCRIVFLCYDITDPESFGDMEDWLTAVRRVLKEVSSSPNNTSPDIHLIGNKIDLIHLRRISEDQHNRFISTHKLRGGAFCSARNGDKVSRILHEAAAKSVGVTLSEYELAFHDKVLDVTVNNKHEDSRMAGADDIEAEDAAREAAKLKKKGPCTCM